MSAREVTPDRLGAWLMKRDPRQSAIASLLARGGRVSVTWCVAPTYRALLMRPGDPLVLWISGARTAAIAPGVWGVGRVRSAAHATPMDADDTMDPAHRDLSVDVDLDFLDEPLRRDELRSHPVLAGIEVLRLPVGANPSWLTKHQWEHLQVLLEDASPRSARSNA